MCTRGSRRVCTRGSRGMQGGRGGWAERGSRWMGGKVVKEGQGGWAKRGSRRVRKAAKGEAPEADLITWRLLSIMKQLRTMSGCRSGALARLARHRTRGAGLRGIEQGEQVSHVTEEGGQVSHVTEARTSQNKGSWCARQRRAARIGRRLVSHVSKQGGKEGGQKRSGGDDRRPEGRTAAAPTRLQRARAFLNRRRRCAVRGRDDRPSLPAGGPTRTARG